MNDITTVDDHEVEVSQFKEMTSISSGETFIIGSKHGLNRAFIGKEPWFDKTQNIPNAQHDSLAVSLKETKVVKGVTSRLQLVIGRDEQGSFYIENLSKVKEGESRGIPLKVIVPRLAEPVFLNPKKENSDNLDSKYSVGGVNALKGIQILWGPKSSSDFAFSLKILGVNDFREGWEAEVRFLYNM